MRLMVVTIALSLTQAASAQGSKPAQGCSATASPSPELAGWSRDAPLSVAGTAAGAAAPLTVGRAARLRLTRTPSVRYILPPKKQGEPGGNGGLASFTVARAGTYRVALGSAAWVDVVRDGKAMSSVGHGHGPACSGIRKMVDFRLEPGRHLLQLAGGADPIATVLVVALP